MKRKLTELEKRIVGKQIKRLQDELEHLRYLERYNDLMLNEGLWRNYVEKKKEFREVKKQIFDDMHINIEKIRIMQEQIDKGVKMIEKKGSVSYTK